MSDEGRWESVEKAYKCLIILSRIIMSYMKYMTAPIIFNASAGVVVLLYVTVRPSGMHVMVYCWFPFAGLAIMSVVLWICYDAVIVTRLADELLGRLRDVKYRTFFGHVQKERQMEILRRGRALRPLSLRVGEFAEFSFSVPYNIWDEVLNQLILNLTH